LALACADGLGVMGSMRRRPAVLCPWFPSSGAGSSPFGFGYSQVGKLPLLSGTIIGDNVGTTHPGVSGLSCRCHLVRNGTESPDPSFFGGRPHRMLLCFCLDFTPLPNLCSPQIKRNFRLRGHTRRRSILQRRGFVPWALSDAGSCFLSLQGPRSGLKLASLTRNASGAEKDDARRRHYRE